MIMKKDLILSTLSKTWILDLDGSLVKHNGYKIDGEDTLLEGVKDFFDSIPDEDYIIILTSRTEMYRDNTIKFLKDNNIRYDNIIFGIPMGERIVVNDRKPSGIDMAFAMNLDRNNFGMPRVIREK